MEENHAAVIGSPINHSLSPKLYNYWLKKYKILGKYTSYDVKPEELEDFLLSLEEKKLIGVNITLPHKENAYEIAKKHGEVSILADKIKAVNIIFLQNGKIFGTNTDYHGFKRALINKIPEFDFENKKILILGAGGAAKSIICGLLNEKTSSITVLNRTLNKLNKLNKELNKSIKIADLYNVEKHIKNSDLIINATSCGLNGENDLDINHMKINSKKIFYDIVYKPLNTKFLKDAKLNNHQIINGLGMLVHQAIPCFNIYYNFLPNETEEISNYLQRY
jgi:shikimate dehydrogenase